MRWRVPLFDLDIDSKDIDRVTSILRSRWLSMGPVVQEFEQAFAHYLGVKHAFAVSNGTAALHLAYLALGLGKDDEVVLPSLTFVATANAALYTGAKPVFADVKSVDDLTVSPDDVQMKISPRTKVLTVMHYGGYICDMEPLLRIAREAGICLVEDAAHAPGAMWKGRRAGTIGDVGCFSFFSNKNLGIGEGGMVVTNRDDLVEMIQRLRSHGMTTLTWDRYQGHASTYDVTAVGHNYRLDEIRAGLGLTQLAKLDHLNRHRLEKVESYRTRLIGVDGVHLPFLSHPEDSVHHLFPILLDDPTQRAAFVNTLRADGIQTSLHYPPLHLFSYYRQTFGFREGSLRVTEDIGRCEVTLPLYPSMREEDIQYVVERVIRALARSSGSGARSMRSGVRG